MTERDANIREGLIRILVAACFPQRPFTDHLSNAEVAEMILMHFGTCDEIGKLKLLRWTRQLVEYARL